MGDNVWIGTNSTVVGNVHIENDVLITPNEYVNFDVPGPSIALGNPGKIIRKRNATDGYITMRI